MKLPNALTNYLVKITTLIGVVTTLGAGIILTPTLSLKDKAVAFELREEQAQAGWGLAKGMFKVVAGTESYELARYCVTDSQACGNDINRFSEGVRKKERENSEYINNEINKYAQDVGPNIMNWAHR
jgi:hypothetical protein